jgi:ATP-dependent DNA ligase
MKQETAINFSFIEPMKALLVTALPAGDWIYELKFDGYRALPFKSGSDVQLVSRNRTSFNKAYPQLIEALQSLPALDAIIDGEIAALDQNGRPSFQLLQAYGKSKGTPLIYYAFDLLKLEGKDLRNRPLVERRTLKERRPRTYSYRREAKNLARRLRLFLRTEKTVHDADFKRAWQLISDDGNNPATYMPENHAKVSGPSHQ